MIYCPQAIPNLSPMAQSSENQRKFHDFNHKNIGLIAAVFGVLVVFMAVQGTLFASVSDLGFTLGKFHSVFAPNPAQSNVNSNGAVLGASTLSPDIEARLSALPVQYAYQDTTDAAATYIQQVQVVESVDQDYAKLSQDLLAIAVPPTLARYQQLIVLRAQLNAESHAASSDQQVAIQANISVVNQQIQQLQSSFAMQGVVLPS